MNASKRILASLVLACVLLIALTQVRSTLASTITFIYKYGQDLKTTVEGYAKELDVSFKNILAYTSFLPLINRGSYINFNGLMANIMGQRYMNGMLKLDNGQLTYDYRTSGVHKAKTSEELRKYTVQVIKLANAQKEQGKRFIFVQAPGEFPKYEDIAPSDYRDWTNYNSDIFLNLLREAGVEVLDLRESAYEQGISNADMFMSVDVHWSPVYAFWAFNEIVNYLAASGMIVNPPLTPKSADPSVNPTIDQTLDINNWELDVYRNLATGAGGRKTGKYFTRLDDVESLIPKFETSISLSKPLNDWTKKGSYKSVYSITLPDNKVSYNHFFFNKSVLGGDVLTPYTMSQNTLAPVHTKLWYIHDSYGTHIAKYFSVLCRSFADWMTRDDQWSKIKDETFFETQYESESPDVVVWMTTYRSLDAGYYEYNYLPSTGDNP
jgi:hypothetical protein